MNDWKSKIKRKGLGKAPREVSENIKNPELASKDSRFTGRTKQLGLRVKPEFLKRLKELAVKEECFLIEILEKALECYDKQRNQKTQSNKKKSSKKQSNFQELYPHHSINFTCDGCGEWYEEETAYSPVRIWNKGKSYFTYCSDCVVE